MSVAEQIRAWAGELGFDAVGFARADVPLDADWERYRAFVAAERHGAMEYLADHGDVRERLDHPGILAGARTAVCLARRYDRPDSEQDPPLARAIARYARGQDYHNHLRKRLQRLAQRIAGLEEGARARALCDTAPVLERAWAARSGMGFIGKNGLLIVPGQGSYCLLGEVVTTVALAPAAYGQPASERCGRCTACLDACPTDAFAAPWQLDARRCISYLTIELRPPADPFAEVSPEQVGEHLFGCDVCQEVCPYNRALGAATAPGAGDDPRRPFRPHDRWADTTLRDLVDADEARFADLVRGSPLRRPGRAGLARNALTVAAQRGAREVVEAGLDHDDPSVRQHARRLLEP